MPTQLSGQMQMSPYQLTISHPGKSETSRLSPTLLVSRNSAGRAQVSLGLACGEVTRVHSPPHTYIFPFLRGDLPPNPKCSLPGGFPSAFQTSASWASLPAHPSAVVPAIGHDFRELAGGHSCAHGFPWCCRTCRPHTQPLSLDNREHSGIQFW